MIRHRAWCSAWLALAVAGCSRTVDTRPAGTSAPARRAPQPQPHRQGEPLASGLRITYAVALDPGPVGRQRLADLVHVVERRLKAAGLATWYATSRKGKLVVELPPLEPASLQKMKDIIQRPGVLELRVVDDGSDLMRAIHRHVTGQIATENPGGGASDRERLVTREGGVGAGVDEWRRDPRGARHLDWYLFAADRSALERYLASLARTDRRLAIDPGHAWGFELQAPPHQRDAPRWRTYLLRHRYGLGNASASRVSVVRDAPGAGPQLLVVLSPISAARFAKLTAANVGRKLAIILDGRVTSAPILMDRIDGGKLVIQLGAGDPTRLRHDAQELAAVLTAGALPAAIRPETVELIEPAETAR